MNEMADSSPDVSREKKQLEAMLYAIQCFPRINRTQLMKYIFFVDLFTYNKRGHPLLENQYRRLPNGLSLCLDLKRQPCQIRRSLKKMGNSPYTE